MNEQKSYYECYVEADKACRDGKIHENEVDEYAEILYNRYNAMPNKVDWK